MKRVMFTVYRQYFDAIEVGTKVIEYRDPKKPWLSYLKSPPDEAVFVSGPRQLVRRVLKVDLVDGKVRFHLGASNDEAKFPVTATRDKRAFQSETML